MYGQSLLADLPTDVDAVLLGTNGSQQNDALYEEVGRRLPGIPQLHYKHLFGECYTTSALGVYAAAHVLQQGEAPAFMRCDDIPEALKVNSLLFVNHSDGENISYAILRRVE